MTLDQMLKDFEAVIPRQEPKPDTWPDAITLDHYRLDVEERQGPWDAYPRRVLTCAMTAECGQCLGDHLDRDTLRPCRCSTYHRRAREVERSGLPPIARRHMLADIDPGLIRNRDEIHTTLNAWGQGKGKPGLVLQGITGTAKTHLAHALLIEAALMRGQRIRYEVWPELAMRLRSVYREDRTPEEHLRPLRRAQVFALDEVGGDTLSEWTLQHLMAVANHAEEHEQRFILTTNLGQDQLAAWAGGRLTSRLFMLCQWVHVDASDYRRLSSKA